MSRPVADFSQLSEDLEALAGGKARTLARLYRDGYPVPDSFVVFSSAFANGQLTPAAQSAVIASLTRLRRQDSSLRVAVRSSATAEDSSRTSFAGEFDSVLNVAGDEAVLDAIHQVQRSRESARAMAYGIAHGLAEQQAMAVLVQRMVDAEFAGVLFTADPVTGSYRGMVGNYVEGLGERLVSGDADGEAFTLLRPQGRYDGPRRFERYGRRLFRVAHRLERTSSAPLDIEWAVAGDRLHLLQARPITTLSPGDRETYDINESLAEDTLWVNTNVSEAIPDVFSPLTWSVIRGFDEEFNYLPGYYLWSGNICGRVYSNIGRRISVVSALTGWDGRRVLGMLGDLFGPSPEQIEIPLYPFSRRELLRQVVPRIARFARRSLAASRGLSEFLRDTPAWCSRARDDIRTTHTPSALIDLWHARLQPYTIRAWWSHTAGSSRILRVLLLERKLKHLVGHEETTALLSNLRGDGGLASLGPLTGLSRVRAGDMDTDDYLRQFGHRGPHEFELNMPDPSEDPEWLERHLEWPAEPGWTLEDLLDRQQQRHLEARTRFLERWPRKRRWLDRRLAAASAGAHSREAARSEFTRVFRVIRAFARRAGELCNIGDDVFLLYLPEVVDVLLGNRDALAHVTARRANYDRFKAMPPLPSVIRGRFDPAAWMRDPARRLDYYDALKPLSSDDSEALKGFPGSAGCVEGTVRVLTSPDCGALLRQGEILVAATTNVGWTPLFPRAAALVTDIGAPLSHAAIVARELGIPAVVGCGSATVKLRTGDRVRVDGVRGIVQRLPP